MIQAVKHTKADASTPWIKQHSQGTQDSAITLTKTRQMHYHACTRPSTPEITMPATLEAESTLTDRYQTTVPETVRVSPLASRSASAELPRKHATDVIEKASDGFSSDR